MTPADARRAVLRAEIERDWEMVIAHLDRARSVHPGAGAAEAALVALSLDHAYQAFENVLVRIERALACRRARAPSGIGPCSPTRP